MQKHISAADRPSVRVVIVTLDNHLSSAVLRAERRLAAELPGLRLSLHAAADWQGNPALLERCRADIAEGDIIIANMLFMEDHYQAVLPALRERRESCDAMVGCIATGDVIKLTKLGRFRMDQSRGGVANLISRLRGARKKEGAATSGSDQLRMLKRIPRILRFIPGTAQDVRAYFLTMQYWLAGSDDNVVNMVRYLVDRYASGPRAKLRGTLSAAAPRPYPEVGVYHPELAGRISERAEGLPTLAKPRGRVGLLLLRSYVLAGNSSHYDGVIAALEAQGLEVVPAFASGLDARPAIDKFFMRNGAASIDALVSLTGFSLVGGPAYNDANAAVEVLAKLDIPYLAVQPIEFQTLEQWRASPQGLLPIESTLMVAIPELDGATGAMVYGGRQAADGEIGARDMRVDAERASMLARRVDKLVALRHTAPAERRVGIVIFNFPPNAGSVGTAAYLSVFESLWNTLKAMADQGYRVELPADADELRHRILEGNSARYGATANVAHRISADDHVRRERWLPEIEAQWGSAPGRHQSDGNSIFVQGLQLGNVFIGVQPAFGYEGDPMRLLFASNFAPTHAFSAFYRWLREDFAAHAVLHFGTHGALEFMPGKQVGLSGQCWPDRLIGDLPNFYLYASNNPSEGALAKRRSAATLISYLTPPVASAGLYRGLLDLKSSLSDWRQLSPVQRRGKQDLAALIRSQAAEVDLSPSEEEWQRNPDLCIEKLSSALLELEYTLIPHGLHCVGRTASPAERVDMLEAIAQSTQTESVSRAEIERLVGSGTIESASADRTAALKDLGAIDALLAKDHEIEGIVRALDGRFIAPAPGGDVVRTPAVLPTGRNLHGFDPYRIPTLFSMQDGARQTEKLLARHQRETGRLPETVAIVLWGADNLKTGGGPIAQALALLGAKPRFDTYGRLAGADLVPLADLGRPRIDVMATVSGIFRDLLPLQIKLLADAALRAAKADEPPEQNFVRKHVLALRSATGCTVEEAALRVFGNADGTYGSNVNHLIENSCWEDASELAETFSRRKGFAYGLDCKPTKQPALLNSLLAEVDLAYQNLESVELGVTTVDTYFDTLGGVSGAVRRAKGKAPPVYIGDQTRGDGKVRTLAEQIDLETRTRVLNPKWYESMLKHGYEGVRHIEAHVTNTVGWSATTGQVAPWVYQRISQTFVLDPAMRERLAALNPTASVKVAHRLIEAHERHFWEPDAETLAALRTAGEELEDQLEGISAREAAA